MNRQELRLVCLLKEIGKIQTFTRSNKSKFSKRMLTLETEDGQLLFCELRKMNLLDDIYQGAIVEVYIYFSGSQKNGKNYNNIFISKLRKR